MQFKVIGTYTYKGSEGVFLESVAYPRQYTACDYSMLPVDEINTHTVIGREFSLPLTQEDLVDDVRKSLG